MLPRREFLATLHRRRLTASAVLRDDLGRVCLVEPTYKDRWLLPGGTVEADESPREGCRREVREELGIDLEPGPLLATTWVPPEPDVDPHGAQEMVYDGGVVTAATSQAFVLPADELRSWRFVAAADVGTLASPRTVAKVEAALRALADGVVVELG